MHLIGTHILKRMNPANAGLYCAWFGMLIYAGSNPIASLLVDVGSAHPLPSGQSAITLTNLLVFGSIISLAPMAFLFRSDLTRNNLERLSACNWRLLALSAVVSSALTPGLFFFALETSSVTNVMLIGRIEPPLFILIVTILFKEQFNVQAFKAGIFALCGAALIIGLKTTDTQSTFGMGELAAVGATLSYIASLLLARRALQTIPMGIYSIFRTIIGTVIYVAAVLLLRGPEEFQGALSPIFWKWIWVYAGLVLVLGQLVWFFALKHARTGEISLATSFSPLATIAFAALVLGEDPGRGLLPGGALILYAMYVGNQNAPIFRVLAKWWIKQTKFTPGELAEFLVPVAAARRVSPTT